MKQLKKLNRRLRRNNQQRASARFNHALTDGVPGTIALALCACDMHGAVVPEAVRRDLNKRGIG